MVSTKPTPKNTNLLYKSSGAFQYCNTKSQKSIPIPIINAVISPKTSGLFRLISELQHIKMIAIMISQLPTVSPTFFDSPTNSATKGEFQGLLVSLKKYQGLILRFLIYKKHISFSLYSPSFFIVFLLQIQQSYVKLNICYFYCNYNKIYAGEGHNDGNTS